jgi:hypothetical protein
MILASGIIAAVAALLLTVRFDGRVSRAPEHWRCVLRYGKIVLLDTDRPKRPGRRAAKRRKARGSRTLRSILRRAADLAELAPGAAKAAFRGLRFFARRVRVERCEVYGTVEGSDPAETAMIFGALSALVPVLQSWVTPLRVAVRPDFTSQGAGIFIDTEASARASTLLGLVLVMLFYMPKRRLARLLMQIVKRRY